MFQIDQCVMYKSSGVCRIVGFEEKSFDGINKTQYCKLQPLFLDNSVCYIPKNSMPDKVRMLHDKEHMDSLISKIPQMNALKIDDSRKRKLIFSGVLKSGDCEQIMSLIKLLYEEQNARLVSGKKLNFSDEKILRDAESLIDQELSVIMGVEPSDAKAYIKEKIKTA